MFNDHDRKILFIFHLYVAQNTFFRATIESLKFLHTLFDKYWDHMLVKFEQNRMTWTVYNFELFDKKMVHHFGQSIAPFWKIFLWKQSLVDAEISI